MSERRQHVIDDGALHRYRTEIPNTIIRGVMGHGLTLPARWLYVYLKSVAGDCGECWQNMTTLAAGAQLSRGAVSQARRELLQAKLIAITKGKGALHETDRIRILDIWQQNMTEFCDLPSSPHEHESGSPHEPDDNYKHTETAQQLAHRVHHMNPSSSSGEQPSSLHEQPSSSGEPKKIPIKKIPNQDLPPIVPPGDGVIKEGQSYTEHATSVSTGAPRKKKGRLNTNYTPGFMRWWAVYPADRRTDKPRCFEKWQELGLEEKTDELVAKIERLKRTTWNRPREERGYIKTSLPYLNNGRFEDELVPLDYAEEQARPRTNNRPYLG